MPRPLAIAAAAAVILSACSQTGTMPSMQSNGASAASDASPNTGSSILKMLKKQVVIGSTIDPKFHQVNPYGLSVAPSTNGDFTQGDLAVCNFNDKANVQGTGYTIVALHPMPGSKPRLVDADRKTLDGCDALALAGDDTIWAAAFSSNDNPVISSSGKLVQNIKNSNFDRPFGQIYAQPTSGSPAFYASNAGNGTIVRVNLGSTFTYDVIAKGFAVNHGKPGSIFGPSGLAYNPSGDKLYIVDGTNNTVVVFSNVSSIPAGGIVVGKDGKSFSGPYADDASLLYSGSPLNGPISSALLANGNIVVGNTTNPSGQNIMVEISPSGQLMATRNVDKGAPGAIFGMVATGSSADDTKLYFNDDNSNNLQVLER
jgi:hypothetical protein